MTTHSRLLQASTILLLACGDDAAAPYAGGYSPAPSDGGDVQGLDATFADPCAEPLKSYAILHSQAELDAWIACGPRPLSIQIEGDVESLAGLSGETRLKQLRIYDSSLSSLQGLENVVLIEHEFSVLRTGLVEISLPALETVTTLALDDNVELRSIRMDALKAVAHLSLGGDDSLVEAVFPALEAKANEVIFQGYPQLFFSGLPQLTKIEIGTLERVEGLSVQELPLVDLTSFSTLKSITGHGALSIRWNNALTSLSGLENLVELQGGLSIEGNPELTNLNALQNLKSWSSFYSLPLPEDDASVPLGPVLTASVKDNPRLSVCEAEALATRFRAACECSGNDSSTTCE